MANDRPRVVTSTVARMAAEVAEVVVAGLAAVPLSSAVAIAVLVVVDAESAATPLGPWWAAALAALSRWIRLLGLALVFALGLGAYVVLGEVRIRQLSDTAATD